MTFLSTNVRRIVGGFRFGDDNLRWVVGSINMKGFALINMIAFSKTLTQKQYLTCIMQGIFVNEY